MKRSPMGEEEDEKRGGHMIRGQKADKRKQNTINTLQVLGCMCALSKNFAPADRQKINQPQYNTVPPLAARNKKQWYWVMLHSSLPSLPPHPLQLEKMEARHSDRDVAVYGWFLRFTLGRPSRFLFR